MLTKKKTSNNQSKKKTVKKVTTKKTSVKKTTKTKKTAKKVNNLHAILRRKKILCKTCKKRDKCQDAIDKTYPYVCMIYEAEEC